MSLSVTAFVADSEEKKVEDAIYRKVTWHILPLLFLCYLCAYLDRVNVGLAKLQMSADLQFSETVYGLGAGIFFIGFFTVEIPSNILLHKLGARVWIARIMISWGLISGATMFVTTPWAFYVLRFFLGVAEAGFYPGVILYLTYWYPKERRGRIYALFATAVPFSGIIGGPLSGLIIDGMNGVAGWTGWQWMFLLEALPSIVMGIAAFIFLTDHIHKAKWLSDAEKTLLSRNISRDADGKTVHSVWAALMNRKVWFMTTIYFCLIMGFYGVGFWLPTLINATGVKSAWHVGLLTAIPYASAGIAMLLIARSADRRNERRWHLALTCVVGGIGLILSALLSQSIPLAMAGLTLGAMGALSTLPLFWSIPTAFLNGTAAAAGIAFINSVGNLGGFVSPYMIGFIRDTTESSNLGMYMLAAFLFLGAGLTLLVPAKLTGKA
ncbi:MFS transporter [Beijerinckia indica]|uniref:Putative tartrate transporter n=1 Tax=Beijerinckia indica subsp. indica (strain ATCC 9039 / DSM 1715 / NCIMB 8712) TaxID=395963 RepID=B2IFW3_BEII9|nr:MFS transporter [Beijerinckia indica]ACB95702.1 major facilitator superfamily MFS_1 [Beijerinckia indica subsp. indica ATCC 9039]